MSRGSLDIMMPDSVLNECQHLSPGQTLHLHGVSSKQNGISNAEEVSIVADRQETALTFRLIGSSMGSVFNRKLSGHWKCHITSVSANDHTVAEENEGLLHEITSEIDRAMGSLPEIPAENFPHIENVVINSDVGAVSNSVGIYIAADDMNSQGSYSSDAILQNEELCQGDIKTEAVSATGHSQNDLSLECNSENQQQNDYETDQTLVNLDLSTLNFEQHRLSGSIAQQYQDMTAEYTDDTENYQPTNDEEVDDEFGSDYPVNEGERMGINGKELDENDDAEEVATTDTTRKSPRTKRKLSRTPRSKKKVCPICGKDIYSRLSRHIATHNAEKLPRHRRRKTTSTNELLKDNPYFCEQCGKTVTGNIRFKDHVRSHRRSVIRCPCTICGKLINKHHLKEHMRTHSGEKPHQCTVCDKNFATTQSLRTHMMIHTGEKKFLCTICGRAFTQKCTLTAHFNLHTGDRPFRCETCGKGFTKQSHCTRHRRSHTDYRPHPCTSCDSKFKSAVELRNHTRIHTGEMRYTCDVCSRQFRHYTAFQIHTRTHTGEKPFHCTTCGKDFRSKTHLNRHKLIHTGEKPYQCDQCEASYNQNGCLKRHILKCHA